MASKDLKTKLIADARLVSGTTIIDTEGCESVTFIFPAGATTSIALAHGDDSALSDAAAVHADFIIGALSGYDADSTVMVGYVGKKRYVRATLTNAEANTSLVCVKSDLRRSPA